MISVVLGVQARKLVVKRVGEVKSSLRSRTDARQDAQGRDCALVIVDLASTSDLTFSGDIVGNVTRSLSGYNVYVSPNTKQIRYSHPNYESGVIDFERIGFDLQGKTTYSVILEEEATQNVMFHVQPANAKLTIGQNTYTSPNGNISVDLEYGDWDYKVTADEYNDYSGHMTLKQGVNDVTIPVELSRETIKTRLSITPKSGKVFVDNLYAGKAGSQLSLPMGEHNIRVIANGYRDEERDLRIYRGMPSQNISLQRLDTRSSGMSRSIRNRMSVYLIGGIPSLSGYDIKPQDNYTFGFGIAGEHYFRKISYFKYGLELDAYTGDSLNNEKGGPSWTLDMPLTINFNIPMGRLNRYGLSFGVGPVLGWSFVRMDEGVDRTYTDSKGEEKNSKQNLMHGFHYGVRGEARLQLWHFVIGASYTWSRVLQVDPRKEDNKTATTYKCVIPALTLGYLF